MSPPENAEYPGAIPWSQNSLLRPLTSAMSLFGAVHSPRGTEIKDLAFHLAAAVFLLLLAARCIVGVLCRDERPIGRGPWLIAQVLLAAWVALSAASAAWSPNPSASLGQASLYAFGLAYAAALAWSIESRDVPRLLWGYVALAVAVSVLCICYFHFRNPNHRPGFPIGNPSTLAACILPALLICGVRLISLWTTESETPARVRVALGLLAAIVPLAWCFMLTDSRGAQVGLIAGAGGALFMLAPRRIRWWTGAALPLLLIAGWWILSANQELAMARGATIRYRLYAWQYAAALWWNRPISGCGAGTFPMLAGPLSTGDRALDPAAFLSDAVDHAHNELFEVLTEIGLLGGVTFVGGYVATLLGAASVLRANQSPARRALLLGLIAGFIGLMADSMFGVGLRLAAVPAVYYTLLALVWASTRSVMLSHAPDAPRPAWLRGVRAAAAIGAIALAVGAASLAARNWAAVSREYAAMTAASRGDFSTAFTDARAAADELLDPVRALVVREHAVRYAASNAERAFAALRSAEPPVNRETLRSAAVDRARQTIAAAVELNEQAPSFGRPLTFAAQSAEMLAELERETDASASAQYATLAIQLWRAQQQQRRFDRTTNLAIARWTADAGELLGLLRDALRSGFPTPEWRERLQAAMAQPGFDAVLDAFVQSVGTCHPETDPDALILHGAGEVLRLAALAAAAKGDFTAAEANAARAAALYRPLRLRYPELYSVAVAERSDYLLRASPAEARRAAALVREAIDALPVIQPQKFADMRRPYGVRLALALLASGDEAGARSALQLEFSDAAADKLADAYVELSLCFVRAAPGTLPVDAWIDAALRQQPAHPRAWLARCWRLAAHSAGVAELSDALAAAKESGVSDADLLAIRRQIAADFPQLRGVIDP